MPFLTVAGVTYQVVTTENPTEQQPEDVGGRNRNWVGALFVQMQAQPRTWSFVLAPISPAAYDTLKAATAMAAFVMCNGDFNNNVAVQCTVDVSEGRYYKPKGGPGGVLYRQPVLTLTETL